MAGDHVDDEVGDFEIEPQMMCRTAYEAWTWASRGAGLDSEHYSDWDDLGSDYMEAWFEVCRVAINMIDGAEGLPWSSIAQALYSQYHDVLGGDRVQYESLNHDHKLIWEAVSRHLANWMAFDDARKEDMESHARSWKEWVESKRIAA